MDRELEFIAVLPFKPRLKGMALTAEVKKSNHPVTLQISPENKFDIIPGIKSIDTSHMLIVKLTMHITHAGDKASLTKRCQSDKLLWEILGYLNTILFIAKFNDGNTKNTKEIRSVGIIDLLFYQLVVDGETQAMQGNSSFYAENQSLQTSLPHKTSVPSNEWYTLVRASELVERGYNSEGLLIAFSLLDSSVQDHLKKKMATLSSDESGDLLSKVGYDRLRIYLGSFHKALTGVSIIEKGQLAGELKWLNNTRNDAIHNGMNCERSDAIKGINLIIKIMHLLNEFGAEYKLPGALFET